MLTEYKIQFTGGLTLDRPLLPQHAAYLDRFVWTRRVTCSVELLQHVPDPLRDAVGLPLGPDGAYFVAIDFNKDPLQQSIVLNLNVPPQGQPSLWCGWRLDPQGMVLKYTSDHNLYLCFTWLQYLLDSFLIPWGYQLQGEIQWQGDDEADQGTIVVKENRIEHYLKQVNEEIQFVLPDEPLFCVHRNTHKTKLVCEHLAGQTPDTSYYRWFTGREHQYLLVCRQCANNFKSHGATIQFRQICWRCYKELNDEGGWAGIVGQPEVLVRSPSFSIMQQRIPFPLSTPLLELQPINARSESEWIAFTSGGDFFNVNLTTQKVTHLARLVSSHLDMTEPVSLHLAPDGQIAAIVNTNGQNGVVVDLSTGEVTMPLERDTYNIEHSHFPIAFFEHKGRPLLVHSTEWNRLDISDPHTGELISRRSTPTYEQGEMRPEHYLDYFHASLSISPGQQWIVDNGWVWHPVGIVVSWDLQRWVQDNVWESEDGPSLRTLCQREYYWDGPLCWINEDTLALWGYGNDDVWLIPAVRLFDVRTSKEIGWFAGPEKGNLVFDEYLFAYSSERDLSAWDVATGERVGYFPDFRPTHYHQGTRQFLVLDGPDSTVLVGKITQQC